MTPATASAIGIRPGQLQDANRLAVLAAQVWLHTYATDGVAEDMARYVLSELTPKKYSALLCDPEAQVLVAEQGQNLLGFAVVKYGAPCPAEADSAAELQTLYVQAHFLGHGLGKQLLQAAEAQARERAGTALWLTVNAQNARAIAFYARQGYANIGTDYFQLGDARHENHVLLGPAVR